MSREDNNFQIAGSLVFFGASFVISGVRRFRKSREVEDTAHIDISSAPQGLVEIQGFAWPCSNTIDTIRGRKAVYQKLVLEKLVRSGKSSSWVEAWSEIFDSNFYATDGTGFVKVDIRDAETEIRKKTTKWTALPQDIKDQLCNRIRTDHFPPTSGFFGTESSFRLCETVILLGAPVYLSGTLETAKVEVLQQTPGLQKFKNFIHKVGGKKIEKFLDFDANRDGVISEEEASVGSNRVGERATGTKTWDSMPPLPNVNFPENRIFGVLKSNEQRKLFIADCHQEHLLKRIGNNNLIRIVGGAIMVGAGVLILGLKFTKSGYAHYP